MWVTFKTLSKPTVFNCQEFSCVHTNQARLVRQNNCSLTSPHWADVSQRLQHIPEVIWSESRALSTSSHDITPKKTCFSCLISGSHLGPLSLFNSPVSDRVAEGSELLFGGFIGCLGQKWPKKWDYWRANPPLCFQWAACVCNADMHPPWEGPGHRVPLQTNLREKNYLDFYFCKMKGRGTKKNNQGL